MNILKQFSRFFVAAVFLFSGFVKIVDPIGTSVKLEKYFHVFSNHVLQANDIEGDQVSAYLRGEIEIGFFSEFLIGTFDLFSTITLPFAVFIIAFEMLLGFALILGYRMKNTAWILLAMILFFTVLTYYTHLTGQPTDCGCFGDFVKLEPRQSFQKDLVLLVFVAIIFRMRNTFNPILPVKINHLTMLWLTIFTFGFAIWTVRHIPLIDFRPYAVGNSLQKESIGIPDIYHYRFKKGEEIIEVEKALPEHWKPPYEYVEAFIGIKGEEANIIDFTLENEYGNDLKEESYKDKSMYIVVRKSTPLTDELVLKINNLETTALTEGVKTYLLSSISKEDYDTLLKGKISAVYTTLDTDISKAVVRSHVGILTLEDGTVKGKWAYRSLPSNEELIESFVK